MFGITILVGALTVVATFSGGLFAIKFRDKLHLVLGFSSGAVLGVAFFELLPEALELTEKSLDAHILTSLVALGFGFFMVLDRLVVLHIHGEDNCENEHHRGKFGAITLAIHSFLDGATIGLAMKISPSVGIAVAAAVLAHDFSDGINTVGIILRNKGSKWDAIKFLILDAIAPSLGLISALFFSIPSYSLGILLSVFCGFFLYIGASDLLPESHHRHPTVLTTVTTILGLGIIYIAIHFAHSHM